MSKNNGNQGEFEVLDKANPRTRGNTAYTRIPSRNEYGHAKKQKWIIIFLLVLVAFLVWYAFFASKEVSVPVVEKQGSVTSQSQVEMKPYSAEVKSASDLQVKTDLLERERVAFELEKARKELALVRKDLESSSELASPKTKMLNTFSCSNTEEKSAGFAAMDIQHVDRSGVSYQISGGCAWLKVSTQVHNLAGGKFLFAVNDSSSPTGKMGCGTYGAEGSYSEKECVRFLNNRKFVEVYTFDTVIIN